MSVKESSNHLIFDTYFEGEEEHHSPFLTEETRKWGKGLTLKAALLAALLLIISFALTFYPYLIPLSSILLTSVFFLAGIPSLIESLEDLANFDLNIDVLMTLAAFGSVVIGSPFEGALLLVLFSLSGAMEEMVSSKAKHSIRDLNKLAPTKAWKITSEGAYIQYSLHEIKVGDKILIKAGEMIPLDGIVLEGTSAVNLSHLTGESLPITKKVGDEVPAGGRNLDGALTVEVLHTSRDSTLAKIITLVTQAEEAKPALALWFDKLSQQYATAIIGAAALFSFLLPWWLNIPFLGPGGGLYRALAFLIAASPCALIIAIPITYLSALGSSAKKGVILKGGTILDALATIKVIAFDKTGTLTTGELHCQEFEGDDDALAIAYALEVNAHHPIAKAIQELAEQKHLKPAAIREFKNLPGYGVEAITEKGQKVYVGNTEGLNLSLSAEKNLKIDEIKKAGDLLAVMRIDGEVLLFRFHDTPRPSVTTALQNLKNRGMRLIMLTGDHEESAKKIAAEMGLEYKAELRPEDKLRLVTEIAEKESMIYVGDGINDAPALARATVGISMGKGGSQAAIDAADVILLHDDLERLDWLLGKASKTSRIVTQNLTLATLAILFAALPALFGLVPLWLAVVMHEGGTVLVGLNGLRLLKN